MKINYFIFTFVFYCSFSYAQKVLVADKLFDEYAYIQASELYEDVLKKGDSSKHVLTRLADCYYNNAISDKASILLEKAIDKYPEIHPEYVYKYVQTLRSTEQYDKAKIWLDKFNELKENDSRLNDLSFIDNNPKVTNNDSTYVTVTNLPINSYYSDFGGYVHNNILLFASSRNFKSKSKKVKRYYKWNNEPFLDIFQATIETDSLNNRTFDNSAPISSEEINTTVHEALVTITKDGQTMYFDRDNMDRRRKISFSDNGTSHVKIYRASLINGVWTNIEDLPFNGKRFSTGNPALSPDNKQLFFASDREEGFGQTDLYVVDINENGTFSEPRNLGEKINTEGKEMFPFVASDSTFYFSSDGHKNYGLLDIFKSDILTNSSAEVENLGQPFNSNKDDFSFNIDKDNKKGFISSNRSGGVGNDDIYEFEYVTVQLPCHQTLTGTVTDKLTKLPLNNATVTLYNNNGKQISKVNTKADGLYTFEVECDKTYRVIGTKEDYKQDAQELIVDNQRKKDITLDLELDPLIQGGQIIINPIYFDYDKSNIRPDAAFELENVVSVLKTHPKMVIKIEAHTDSRGRNAYNKSLSDRRAKATRDYLYTRGVEHSRIESAIGYGEEQLLNKCADGVKCTEEEHQLNRRSYFYILKR